MDRFLSIAFSVQDALARECWYPALATALTLPDVCMNLQTGQQMRGADYAAWFDQWMGPFYTLKNSSKPEPHVFLCGGDAYALRCAFLHEGSFDTTGRRARKVLERFAFQLPPAADLTQAGPLLILDLARFCRQMVASATAWHFQYSRDPEVAQRIAELAAPLPAGTLTIGSLRTVDPSKEDWRDALVQLPGEPPVK